MYIIYRFNIFTFIFAVLLPVSSRLSCHSIHDYTANFFLKMNRRHQARNHQTEMNNLVQVLDGYD